MNINAGKSKYIIIGSEHNLKKAELIETADLKVGGNKIDREKVAKNLGVIFDEKLTWEQHTGKLIQNAYYKLRQFYHLKKCLSKKTKSKLVETYVLSQLNYCDMVTQATTVALRARIQRVQNACIRFIFGLRKFEHITPFIQQLDTLNMENRTKQHALTLMHKIVNNNAPVYLTEKLSYRNEVHNYNTRNCQSLNIRRLHNSKKKNAFFVKTAKEYNTFNEQNIFERDDTLNLFKKKIKLHLKHIQQSN